MNERIVSKAFLSFVMVAVLFALVAVLAVRHVTYPCGHRVWEVYGISVRHQCPVMPVISNFRQMRIAQKVYRDEYGVFASDFEMLKSVGAEDSWLDTRTGYTLSISFGQNAWSAVLTNSQGQRVAWVSDVEEAHALPRPPSNP